MNVCGIDCSTYAVDFVFIDENWQAEWRRITLEGQDGWERCRTVRVPSDWFEDTEAVGVEVAFGPSSGQINRVIGAVLSRLPRELLVQPWAASQWKKAVGMKGNASKGEVRLWAALHFGPRPEYTGPIWPQDACDAYCIALATRAAVQQEAA